MGVRILFLGPLSDLAGESEIEVAAPLDWEGLLGQVDAEIAQHIFDVGGVEHAGSRFLQHDLILARLDGVYDAAIR